MSRVVTLVYRYSLFSIILLPLLNLKPHLQNPLKINKSSGSAHSEALPDKTSQTSLFIPLISHPVKQGFQFSGVETFQLSSGGGIDKMASAGVNLARRNALVWLEVEPSQGVRNWKALVGLEEELIHAANLGLDVILIIRSTPGWAQARPGTSCGPIRQDSSLKGFDAFASFLYDVVARYSIAPYNVRFYEIWNEPDMSQQSIHDPNGFFGCWGDDLDDYFGGGYYGEMLKIVYPKVKQANPDAQLLLGGLVLDCDPGLANACSWDLQPRFFEGVLRSGAGDSFDGVSYHAYDYYLGYEGQYANGGFQTSWNTSGPAALVKADFIRNLLEQYGHPDKYLIASEVAILCGTSGKEDYCLTKEFENTKAYYLTQLYTMGRFQSLHGLVWYSIFGWRASELLDSLQNPKPAYHAFQFSNDHLAGLRPHQELDLGSGLRGYEFQDRTKVVWVVWSLDGNTHTITLNSVPTGVWKWNSASGNYGSATPSLSMNIGLAPIYFEWNK